MARNSSSVVVLAAVLLVCIGTPARAAATCGDPAHPENLLADLNAAHSKGVNPIVITPGYYNMPGPHSGKYGLPLWAWKNVTVSCYGCTFMINDRVASDQFIFLWNCSNVTWAGGTITCTQMPMAESPIVSLGAVDSKGYRTYNVSTPVGYPALSESTSTTPGSVSLGPVTNVVDAATHEFKPNSGDFYSATGTYLGTDAKGSKQFNVDLNGLCAPLSIGDVIVNRVPTGAFNIYMVGCKSCTIKDVTLCRSGASGLSESQGSANVFKHVVWAPGPPPVGSTVSPLFSGWGSMIDYDTVGPTFEDCKWLGLTDDDIINLGGRGFEVTAVASNTITFVNNGPTPLVGHSLRIFKLPSPFFYCEGTVTAVNPLGSRSVVTLDRNYNIPSGCYATDPFYCGQGYRVVHCQFGSSRARCFIA